MVKIEKIKDAVLSPEHYLTKSGWIKSFISRVAEDIDGNPLPWYSYSSIAFLEPRLKTDMIIFEFGAGYSTLFYGQRVAEVIAVEDKPTWCERIKDYLIPNVKLMLYPKQNDFVYSITSWKKYFDIICIDGEYRSQCARVCLPSLKDNGVIIWDNANRFSQSENRFFPGFKRLDFYGLTPVCTWGNCTSIFYRENNCLGI